jgi:hypothetical protein
MTRRVTVAVFDPAFTRITGVRQLLNGPACNISAQTAEKTSLPLLLHSVIAMETCLFSESLPSNSYYIVAYFAAAAEQQIYMNTHHF